MDGVIEQLRPCDAVVLVDRPVHCVQNTRGAEYHKDLRIPQVATYVDKATDPERELELKPGDGRRAIEGVRNVIRLAREPGTDFRVRAVRLDSGDLAGLAAAARELLDDVEIFASGNLDEYRIAELVHGGAPIDGFGVGTRMGGSRPASGRRRIGIRAQDRSSERIEPYVRTLFLCARSAGRRLSRAPPPSPDRNRGRSLFLQRPGGHHLRR